MITTLVFVMMVLVDYLNILTQGKLHKMIQGGGKRQYPISAGLGALPGCYGAFTNASLYMHGLISFGAIVGGMIATSGDEAFVMFSLFPKEALLLTVILFFVGILVALLVDNIDALKKLKSSTHCLEPHIHKEDKILPKFSDLVANLREPSPVRFCLLIALGLASLAFILGLFGPQEWELERIIFLILTLLAMLIIGITQKHYLNEHIWKHIAKKHLMSVMLWTFFALSLVDILANHVNLESMIHENIFLALIIACLAGLIPSSGPHLVFVMLFVNGLVPFSILLASSIVQDGHGALPLLSFSVKDVFAIKLINFVVGLLLGALVLAIGY